MCHLNQQTVQNYLCCTQMMNNYEIEDIRETIKSHKICVLIPTFNNAGTLRNVLTSVMKYSQNVIVVNDGSTDHTADILKEFENAIDIVSYPQNKGKGFALKTGFKHAKVCGFTYAITIDSDNQHYAADIPYFVKAIVEHPGALIIGERDLSNVDINGKSSFANKFSNFWFRIQTGKKLNDTQTGYRAYPLDRLFGLSLLTSRYEAELELLVFASWHGVKLISIPIQVYYPPQSERISHFNPILDFTRISILNTILCGAAIVYGLPARLWNRLHQKRIFNAEFTPFTRKQGVKKEAATTMGRLVRSIYGLIYFVFWSIGVFTPLILIYFSIGKNTEAKKIKLHRMLQWVSKFLTKRFPGVSVVYENVGNEDFQKPALIICNHQSHLDLPVLMSVHHKMIFLTNDWVWNNFFYGKIIHKAEFLPVSAGMNVIIPHLRDLKERGYSIVVFPEGTRSADCSILRFHQGAFHLAKELELDIVPMVLHGAGHYLPKNDFMFRTGSITLRILNRIPFNSEDFKIVRQQASKYRKLIQSEYYNLVREKESAEYFKSLILYKYTYRGWRVVSQCKAVLKKISYYSGYIDNESEDVRTVQIVNSGFGVFAMLYALVNKNVEVYAYEENVKDYTIACETAVVPSNLHWIHPIFSSDYRHPDVTFDKTYVLTQFSAQSKEKKGSFKSNSIIFICI